MTTIGKRFSLMQPDVIPVTERHECSIQSCTACNDFCKTAIKQEIYECSNIVSDSSSFQHMHILHLQCNHIQNYALLPCRCTFVCVALLGKFMSSVFHCLTATVPSELLAVHETSTVLL
jgi:hypothetical protein